MLTEKDISTLVQRAIKSPIRMGLAQEEFLTFFQPFFENLEDDTYLTRQNQLEFLLQHLPQHQTALQKIHRAYFEGQLDATVLQPYAANLTHAQKTAFEQLSIVTRQRGLAIFTITTTDKSHVVQQVEESDFQQNVDDFREWKRVFAPMDARIVAAAPFQNFLKAVAHLVQQIHPKHRQLNVTVHLMRTLAYPNIAGENAPEGIHEDGTHYIVSALVVNRKNALGGESRIYEKMHNNQQHLLYKKTLAAGEFIFQADTGEEATFGNDLWHNVSAITPEDNRQAALRDIIGLDIDLVK